MTTPTGPARRGRRRPEILEGDGIPDAPVELDQAAHLGEVDQAQHAGEDDQVAHEPLLVMEGDIVTASATLAVDFGDGKTNYFRYAHTTRVAEEEDHVGVYGRVATVVNEGVISLIDDNKARMDEYNEELTARYQRAQAIAAQQAARR